MSDGEPTTATPFVSVAQFCERHPWAKAGGIRHAIFFARDNGLEASGALVYFGRRLLLDEVKFIAWIREHGAARGSLKHGRVTARGETKSSKGRRTRSTAAA